ncbi:iron-sulfur cluster-binding protein, Rieske family [Plesiocystis pacifica SIR-1]|uniref:Iron-sulfur cluster-binding protein, Rieske family n=1 Tax=Plesiocystis pacifica SIR-1 TaxID=391625 RepID=A6GBW7_9BACT|nr:aromatic ring-hydroxylating dioxygenase subunit alpha [Plesiocystis pacifica]EDM76640.1 iron-sulfur cluster-binding protein, Rieske family [Plesiocystis pacifica SIR-1]
MNDRLRTALPVLSPRREPVLIPEAWYPIAPSTDLPARGRRATKPLGIMRLGRRWVLWRDEAGAVACMPAACPHRGADLAQGRVRQGEIECPYHGFRWSAGGECVALPCEGRGARVPAKLHVRERPIVREAHGLIWMWYGEREPTAQLPWFERSPVEGRRTATHTEVWEVSFTRTMEAMQDLHHFPFAHHGLDPWRGKAARLDPYECRVEGERIYQKAALALEREDGSTEPVVHFQLDCAFPSGIYLKFSPRVDASVALCPIDEQRTWVWACYRVETGLGAVIDKLSARLSMWFEFAFVQPDDRRMSASAEPQACTAADHALVRSDAAIAAWHKLRRAHLHAASASAQEHSPLTAGSSDIEQSKSSQSM